MYGSMTLETKLNKLIELWRKPYWLNFKKIEEVCWLFYLQPNISPYSLNDLCSISSLLRQFVCEKWLVVWYSEEYDEADIWPSHIEHSDWTVSNQMDFNSQEDYQYRLMLSSIQEDKEKFLLDNIVLPNP